MQRIHRPEREASQTHLFINRRITTSLESRVDTHSRASVGSFASSTTRNPVLPIVVGANVTDPSAFSVQPAGSVVDSSWESANAAGRQKIVSVRCRRLQAPSVPARKVSRPSICYCGVRGIERVPWRFGDVPSLVFITDSTADPLRDVVFQLNGIRDALLSQECRIQCLISVRCRSGSMLWAGYRGVWSRTKAGKRRAAGN